MTDLYAKAISSFVKNAAAACRAQLESAMIEKSGPMSVVLLTELTLTAEREFAPGLDAVQRITLQSILGYGSGPVSDRIFDEIDAESERKRGPWYCVEKGAVDALREELRGILGAAILTDSVWEKSLPAAERVARTFVSCVAQYLCDGAQAKELEAQLASSMTREFVPLIKKAATLLSDGVVAMGQGRPSSFLSDEHGASVTLASETQWAIVNGAEFDALRAALPPAGAA